MTRVRSSELRACDDLARAREILTEFRPANEEQAATRARMLAFIEEHPADAHRRTCIPGHLTASALVIDARGERALLTHHRKLGRWLQLGGHCDGDANLPNVALREAIEESGIERLEIDPAPVDLDVHWIPPHKTDPGHWHLDTRFLIYAPHGARELISDESLELSWWSPAELGVLDTDDSVRRLFSLAFRLGS
jgi:8-oxo-dGTP pyrophosphatase MutT (NUDIX family)